MDPNHGGLSSSELQRRAAAENARQRVLAVYSSTVQNLRKLPVTPKSANRPTNYSSSTTTPYTSTNPSVSPTNNYQTSQTSRTPQTTPSQTVLDQNPSVTMNPSTPYQNSSVANSTSPTPSNTPTYSSFKDAPINLSATSDEWKKYHSAWQDYYKNYYSDYYSKAAQSYLATEKMKNQRAASEKTHKIRNLRRAIPAIIVLLVILTGLFLQYNRLIFAPIMAYIVPEDNNVSTNISAVDPTITQTVSPDPRLIIPKLNIDVPVAFSIDINDVMEAMNHGVAQFSIPGANALPGQIGNLVISGHSAGDIYSNNPYKFIFSGLERLAVGDLIYVNYNSTRYTYQVTGDQTVEPTDVNALIYPTDKPILTLITCTPLGTSRYRLLVAAEQISPSYNSDDIANETPAPDITANDPAMPANSPSFFENIWNGIFGE